jgi:hypothetical protein
MNDQYFDIYGENDLTVFQALADLVVQERVTGRKPTLEQVNACGKLENPYSADKILAIVMLLASGREGSAYKLEPLGTVGELRERGEI